MQRLAGKEAVSQAQFRVLKSMNEAEGLCVCGFRFKKGDGRFILCKVGIKPADTGLQDALEMYAFCFSCAQSINQFINMLRKNGQSFITQKK